MTVLILERAAPGVRGELSRWVLEIRAGVFVGTLSARVRNKLFELVCNKTIGGAVIMMWPARNEQGFAVRTFGDTTRAIVDVEGLTLVAKRPRTEDDLSE